MTKARDLANASTALSAVSSAELAFLDGVTSAVQTQLDAKQESSTAVTLTGTQTLTNKTLTSPVISSVINNTLTSTTGDMIYASANNTPARLAIGSTSQVLTVASGVPSWATPASSSLTSASATVATTQTTTSGTFTDLATAGPAVTITTGTKALILITCQLYKSNAGSNALVGFAVSGATTVAAASETALNYISGADYDSRLGISHRITGLTAGSNTFTLKYRQVGGGTATFLNREIIVIDLGS